MHKYYIRRGQGSIYGPFVSEQIIEYIQNNTIVGTEQISTDKINWQSIIENPQFYDLLMMKLAGDSPEDIQKKAEETILSTASGKDVTRAIEPSDGTKAPDESSEAFLPPPDEDEEAEWAAYQERLKKKARRQRATRQAARRPARIRLLSIIIAVVVGALIGWWWLKPVHVEDSPYYFDITPVIDILPSTSPKDPFAAEKSFYEGKAWFYKDTPYHYVLAADAFLNAFQADHTYVAAIAGYLDSLMHLHRLKLITPQSFARVNQLLDVAYTLYPRSPHINRSMALSFILRKMCEPALTHLEESLKVDPNSPETLLYYGYLHMKKGETFFARENFELALKNQQFGDTYLTLGYYWLSRVMAQVEKAHDIASLLQTTYELSPIHPFLLADFAKEAYALKIDEGRAQGDLLIQTLWSLGRFLPVDIHKMVFVTLLERAEALALKEETITNIQVFLAHHYPSLTASPQHKALFENFQPTAADTPSLESAQRDLFRNIERLRFVADSFFATPDKVQTGIDLYLVCLWLDPKQPDIYQKLGDHFSFIRTPQAQARAMTYYEKALDLDPSLENIVFTVFEKAIYFYDFHTAAVVLARYEDAMEQKGEKPSYKLWLSYGELYHALDDSDEALKYYRRARNEHPSDANILKKMSQIAAEADFITDAIVLSRQALRLNPEDTEELSRISVLTAREGRRLSSLEWPTARLEEDPNDPWGALTLGKIHFVFKEYEKAVPLLEKGLEALPENKKGWDMLARIFRETGEFQKAVDAYAQMSHYPDNPVGYAKAADYLMVLDRKEEALANYLKAARINFRYPGINYTIAKLFRELNYPNEAIKHYQLAIEIDPEKIEYQIELGEYLLANEFYHESNVYFMKLYERYPNNVIAMIYIARINRALGNYETSQSFAAHAVKIDPQSPAANKELGLAYYYQDDFENANQYLSRYLQLDPLSPDRREIERLIR